jgi:hypothetical protein
MMSFNSNSHSNQLMGTIQTGEKLERKGGQTTPKMISLIKDVLEKFDSKQPFFLEVQ